MDRKGFTPGLVSLQCVKKKKPASVGYCNLSIYKALRDMKAGPGQIQTAKKPKLPVDVCKVGVTASSPVMKRDPKQRTI